MTGSHLHHDGCSPHHDDSREVPHGPGDLSKMWSDGRSRTEHSAVPRRSPASTQSVGPGFLHRDTTN